VSITCLDHRPKLRNCLCCLVVWTISVCGPVLAQIAPDESTFILQQAKAFEAAADYANAAASYREYLLLPAPKSAQRRHSRLKLPVLQEAAEYGVDTALSTYLRAMDLRADGKSDQADAVLAQLINTYVGSSMLDDSLYMRAYIALMDRYDYQQAKSLLRKLHDDYPQSRYVDTALYAEAIVLEQLGETSQALEVLTHLKDRHTGISIGGMNWARDEFVSRLWFERSSARIEYLHQRENTITQFVSMNEYGADGYQLVVELIVAQRPVTLLLNESKALNDLTMKGVDAIELSAYSGVVMGQPESWGNGES